MFLAIAAQTYKHPKNKSNYRVWYLELNELGSVIGIGVKTREELVQSLMSSYKAKGKSNWRAMLKGHEQSSPIELYDFISQGMFENTHFGNLPTIDEFQEVLDRLEANLEIRPTRSCG